MADREEIIRIILDGRDKLSNVARGAAKNLDESLERIRSSYSGVEKGQRDLDRAFDRTRKTLESQDRVIKGTTRSVNDLTKSFKSLAAESELGNFAKNLKKGFQIVEEQNEKMNGLLGRNKEFQRKAEEEIKESARLKIEDAEKAEELLKRKIKDRIDLEKRGIKETRTARLSALEESSSRELQLIEVRRKVAEGILKLRDRSADAVFKAVETQAQKDASKQEDNARKIFSRLEAKLQGDRQAGRDLIEEIVEQRKRDSEERISELKLQIERERQSDEPSLNEILELQNQIARERRKNTLAKLRKQVKKELAASKDFDESEIDFALEQAKQDLKDALKSIEKGRQQAVKEGRKAANEQKAQNKEVAKEKIANADAAEREIRSGHKKTVDEEIAEETRAADNFLRTRLKSIRNAGLARRREIRRDRDEDLRKIGSGVDDASIVANTRKEVSRLINEGSRLDIVGKKLGRSFGDAFLGFRDGKAGLRELSKEARKSESAFTRFGFSIGKAASSTRGFFNLRWATIIGFVTVFATYALRLGAALVAVASSALQAAAALGGALVSGLLQAIPVVGILGAAFQRLGKVMDALKQAEQNRITSADDLKAKNDEIKDSNERLADSQWDVMKATEAVSDAQYAVKKAHDSVKDAVKRHQRSIEALADAQYEVRQAQKRVNDSIKDNKRAISDLAEARIKAAQDIKDANLNEQEAALSLQEAELALIDAKRKLREENEKQNQQTFDIEGARAAVREAEDRLKKARAEGDQAEISKAAQQANIAQQNLNAILDQAKSSSSDLKDLELGVKRAEINVKQAQARNKQAKIEAARARKKGVEGSDVVVSAKDDVTRTKDAVVQAQRDFALALRGVRDAKDDVKDALDAIADAQRNLQISNRGVRDAVHALAIAKREEADARAKAAESIEKETAGQKKLRDLLADFSPSERKVYNSAKKLQDLYRKVFVGTSKKDGILGPINDAIAGILDTLFKLLSDPKIQKAVGDLAKTIGDGFVKIGKFVASKGFKDNLLFFIREATENLPTVVDIFLKLFTIFTDIGKAAAPIFRDLLDTINGWLDKLGDTTKDRDKMEKFFASAGKHLKSWIEFAGAVGNLILALSGASASEGKNILEAITDQLNSWAEWIRDNPKKVQDFFKDMRESLGRLTGILFKFVATFTKLIASKDFEHFAEFFLETFIPAIFGALKFMGVLAGLFNRITEVPFLGDFIKLVAQFLIFRRVMYFLLPGSKLFGAALGTIAKEVGKFLLFGSKIGFIGKLLGYFRGLGTLLAAGGIAKGIRIVGAALRFVFIANPWIAAIAGAIALIILLDKKFHFIRPTIEFVMERLKKFGKSVIEFFQHPIRWLKNNWETLLKAALLGPFAPIYLLFKKQIDKIAGYVAEGFINGFKSLGTWFKNIGTWLYEHLIKPILKFFQIASPSRYMYNIGKQIVQGLVNAFLEIPNLILGVFKKLPGLILNAITFGPKFIFDLLKKIPGFNTVKDAVSSALGLGKKAAGKVKDAVTGVAGKTKDVAVGAGKAVAGKAADVAGGVKDFFFGGGPTTEGLIAQANADASGIFNAAGATIEGTVAVLRNKGLSDIEILKRFEKNGVLSKKRIKELRKKAKGMKEPIYSLGGAGLLSEGNINLLNRPRVKRPDGSISTVRTITVSMDTDEGTVFVLIPTVIGNRVVSNAAAIKRFQKTGLNFGVFDSESNADIYAHKLHAQQANLLKMATGGSVPGSGKGDTVPAMLTPGEWVLNKAQQDRLSKFLGVTAQQLQATIFGTNIGSNSTISKDGLVRYRSGANLVAQTDEDGNQIWFIQLKNGTFGQVTGRDAAKIQATDGQWIPQYVRRSKAGFQGKMKIASQFNNFSSAAFNRRYALGGVVQAFAGGGIVQNPGFNQINRGGANVHQNFNVTTQGETDWAYVMRLSAITAQGAF